MPPKKILKSVSQIVKQDAQPPIDFHIQDVAGISSLDLSLHVGMNLLRGRNGAGKSSAMMGISRACGIDVPIEVRDGATEGRISGNGVSIVIRKVAATTGKAEVELVGGEDLAELIDGGGYADPKARAKARVRALLRIERLPVTEETIETLAGGESSIAQKALRECEENLVDDLLDAAEKVRRVTHAEARLSEEAQASALAVADVHESQAAEAVASIGGADFVVDIPAADAAANAQRLRDRLAVAKSEAQKRRELEALQAEIRETLGQRPDAAQFNERYSHAQDAREACESELEELQAEAQALADRIAAKRVAVVEAKELQQRIGRKISETQTATEEWDRRAGVLGRPVDGPTQADVDQLEASAALASETATRAALSADFHAKRDAAAESRQGAAEHATRAEYLRTLATTVQDRLGQLLNGTDADGLTVGDAGRVCVVEGGKVYDFETRRSEGQQIAAALRFFARKHPSRIIPLSGRLWNALDPQGKASFIREAEALGLYCISEEPAEGDLRVERPTADGVIDPTVAA